MSKKKIISMTSLGAVATIVALTLSPYLYDVQVDEGSNHKIPLNTGSSTNQNDVLVPFWLIQRFNDWEKNYESS